MLSFLLPVLVACLIVVVAFKMQQQRGTVPVDASHHATADAIDFYWRPGCPWCERLGAGLERESIPHRRLNIWEDPAHAAVVRSIADGNETVPTVVIAGVGLVNPSLATVKKQLAEHAPGLAR